MLKFAAEKSENGRETYALTDGDKKIGELSASGGIIESVSFIDEKSERLYRNFMLRSAAFVLRDKYKVLGAKFTDSVLESIGYVPDGKGGMTADPLKIRFDGCGCREGENL